VYTTLMSLEAAALAEAGVTQRTLVRSVADVHSHVDLERPGLTERLVADVAAVWLVARVDARVSGHVAACREAAAARRARVQLLLAVSAAVLVQVLLGRESLVAERARKRPASTPHGSAPLRRRITASVSCRLLPATFRALVNIHMLAERTAVGRRFLAL